LKLAGDTDTTPPVWAISSLIAFTAAFGLAVPLASSTTVSGPLKPGPNPSASAS
jgi:hypothetical protein